jgi:hypothetical protein
VFANLYQSTLINAGEVGHQVSDHPLAPTDDVRRKEKNMTRRPTGQARGFDVVSPRPATPAPPAKSMLWEPEAAANAPIGSLGVEAGGHRASDEVSGAMYAYLIETT